MNTPTAQAAILTLQQQLIAARASSDRVAECEALGNLGIVYYQGKKWHEAIATFTNYLNLAKKLGHQWQEGIAYLQKTDPHPPSLPTPFTPPRPSLHLSR
ncbi:hypothetical protein [Coleofasciculus sp. G2-EDA-02]|uniref:hypothetical protein n=1 Tax=unclassified Coleofasciculus TaxID=2692782 RepID=UPI0033037BC1